MLSTKIEAGPSAPVLVPCRCMITPALFYSHKSLPPEVLRPQGRRFACTGPKSRRQLLDAQTSPAGPMLMSTSI